MPRLSTIQARVFYFEEALSTHEAFPYVVCFILFNFFKL